MDDEDYELDFYDEVLDAPVSYEDLADANLSEALSLLEDATLIESDLLFRRFHLEINCFSNDIKP